jgi:oligopeptidase A
MSLPPPNYGKPSLLSFAETEELLRNFGNLLMHILSAGEWSDLSGKAGVEWDAIDLAGNFMTQW